MSYDLDEDILQDFLVEAGEILELLSEQLVELENNPDDKDLLNAIFRGFHTVKGGAGFLALTELVDTCHGAENVFDILRNGQRSVTSGLMDTMLQALDTVNTQFQAVQDQEPLVPADQALLDELHRLCKPESADEVAPVEAPAPVIPEPVVTAPEPVVESSNISASSVDDISEDEFERLLDELHGKGGSPTAPSAPTPPPAPVAPQPVADSGDITDDEFEKLLDELHGAGNSPTAASSTPPPPPAPPAAPVSAMSEGDDLMTDEEFEKLLDQLHGSGNGPSIEELDAATKPAEVKSAAVAPQAAPKPAAPVVVKEEPKPSAPAKTEVKAPAKKQQAEATVRVDTSTLDTIMNMVGELVLVRNRLVSLGLNSNDEEMSKAVSNLDVVTADLQGAVMKTRMQPIKKVFGRFPRVVRDLARSLKKDIVLEMRGEETDLDKNLVEALADPLIHLVRNSVDHGIEMPNDRVAAGKSQTGKVILSASQEGDHIELAIVDDGGGMDPDKLRAIAVKRGLMDEDAASRLSNKECFNLIFAPGFSSKEQISDISGRGVGMDVVKTAINTLNGSIDIDSEMGQGTKITIKVPLTLAILPTLMVGVAGHPFALPLASVNEIFHLDLSRTNVVDGQLTIIVRDKSIPLFYLQNWLAPKAGIVELRKGHGHVVIVQLGSQRVGFVVDTLIGQEEVVIKPLDKLLQGTPGMAGATITSDGHIALILDVPDLLKQYAAASRI
ncbi:two-component system, chemotaxis family, sensor kinase CheA [Vibrio crassostreae]|uniref:chemotaxis protein CheA n=1 Tax=Vibrio crassostreae TaxID=246167 RepID=UPI001B30D5EB|nr:chemotaxis protein CheA [Vibrio crassostreae]CAK1804137.1 two-component system, chemotaxis family, sensor kinase CheA [Vibrio crassostreae]CAK1821342.1 two-component system, chemotaxis family, sensor kinase CheA [Vibrio crassostreae]CAK1821876.1 two-component system, chemotaxis family, sensor kinase CheA [Vibrio crassostreae]CAK1822291.1 two-component system, chemotaxis family, sensor kinase CheA [Vibrio crassostreae]CAK1822661.1 two-component system, chemotaxis family, sensor kinase CheA [